MNIEEKLEIIKHITLGTNEVLYYPYNFGKEPLPVRPLSSFELDQCIIRSLDVCHNPEVAAFMIKYRLSIIKDDEKIEISPENYKIALEFHNHFNYWVVYHAMKDFQDSEFSKIDVKVEGYYPKGFHMVKKMQEVHEISDFVLAASTKNEDVIKEIFEDELGREIAFITYYLGVPLAEFSKLTNLQKSYLFYSKGNLHKFAEKDIKDKYIRSDEIMTLKELLEKFK